MTLFLARGDYSQIEARVNPWLAGAAWKLDAFRAYDAGTGPDLYKVAAAGIYRVPVSDVAKDQRQIGKVAELALGYQGGKGAFKAMAKGYGVRVSDDQAEEIKLAWRTANPEIVAFWYRLNDAAVECMSRVPGTVVQVGRTPLTFMRTRAALSMRLPSGRRLIYWSAVLRDVPTPWGARAAVVYRAEDSMTKRWAEFVGYGGLFCENAVQATARDLMADALLQLDDAGLNPLLTVHDEAVCLVDYPTPAEAASAVESIMRRTPQWAAGLPVAADASAHARYVKG
jgi:DNA polymerase